jgi:hypothetical protein
MSKPNFSLDMDKVAQAQEDNQKEDQPEDMADQRPIDIIIVDLNKREIN